MSDKDAACPTSFRFRLLFWIVSLGILSGLFVPRLTNLISPLFLLGGLACFTLFVIMLLYPTIGIYLVITSSVFDRVSWEVKGFTVRIAQLMVVILCVVWLIRFLIKKEKLFKTSIGIPIIFLFLINLISSLINSPILRVSLQRCALIAVIFLTYFTVVNLSIRRPHLLKNFILVFLLVGVGEFLYCVISMLVYLKGFDIGGIQLGQWGNTVTSRGTFLEANLLGSYSAVLGVFFLTYLLSSYYRKQRKWLAIAFMLTMFTLIMSWTRGAWLAFLVGSVVVLFLLCRKRIISARAFYITTLIILITLGFFFLVIASNIEEVSQMGDMFVWKLRNFFDIKGGTGAYRFDKYTLAISHWQARPLLGWGTDSFKVFGKTAWIGSSVLHTLHDTGIIGLLIFVWLMLKVLLSGLKALKITEDVFFKVNLIAFIGSFLGLFIAYQVSTALWLPFPWVHLGLMIAIVRIALRQKGGGNPENKNIQGHNVALNRR